MIQLTGITWNHTRGYLPMVATAQRCSELHPDVEIAWQKRSLQAFADAPVEELAQRFDLLVIDHPHIGAMAASGAFLPLDEHLSADFLQDQAENSVGLSHPSYQYDGHLWALAIDAATPVASYRPDLLPSNELPANWDELMLMAKGGRVCLPAIPVDSVTNFYMCCLAQGETPFEREDRVVSDEVALAAIDMLRQLVSACDPACLQRNPIQTAEAMVASDHLAYCPFAFGYSNYSRPGYSARPLHYANLLTFRGQTLRSTLGGTGLAISAKCADRDTALAYAKYVASPATQRGLFFEAGGQPGHRSAWLDDSLNAATANFFGNTLQTLDNAYLRPRYHGYMHFQDHAGHPLWSYLAHGGDPKQTLTTMNRIYQESTVPNP